MKLQAGFLALLGLAGGAGWGFAQINLEFTGIQRLTNREMLLKFIAPTGQYCRIHTSSDLAQWHGWQTLLYAGLLQYTDSAAPYLASRFYRAEKLGATNFVTGDHLVTADGEVIIHPINHATFVMQWKGKMIYSDPVGGATPFTGLPKADVILVTHSHGDHFHAATIDAVRQTNAAIVAPQAVYASLSSAQKALTTMMTNGATATVQGIAIKAVPAYNMSTSNHPKGAGNGYLLTIGGKVIYVAGDTDDTPEMRALRDVEVAFLPMNQPYTMTVAMAASAVRAFQPKVVYPIHYRNSDNTYADLNAFKKQVGTDLGIEVRLRKWY
jgi:L-ascorbate metabolism protein UlaG (beta-lactamase superfamily)